MGGYGGLMLGLRHPDMFCSVGSQSGALAFARQFGERIKQKKPFPARQLRSEPNKQIGIEGFMSQVERSPKGAMFTTAEEAAAYDPFEIVLKIPAEKMPHICIDCGTEDGLIVASQEFMKLLMEHKIPFTYSQSKGEHRPAYWTREVGEAMAIQMVILQRNMAADARLKKSASK
jgi:S-formylglutathione hydrolase FrmB